jgi:TPR repeat protein
MKMKTFLCLAIVCLFTACTNLSYKQGQESFLHQDYRQAFIRLMPPAKAGNAQAQYAIGYMYYNGLGTIENKDKALFWLNEAASQGSYEAIKALKLIKNKQPSPYQPSSNPKKQPLNYD